MGLVIATYGETARNKPSAGSGVVQGAPLLELRLPAFKGASPSAPLEFSYNYFPVTCPVIPAPQYLVPPLRSGDHLQEKAAWCRPSCRCRFAHCPLTDTGSDCAAAWSAFQGWLVQSTWCLPRSTSSTLGHWE